MPRRKSPKNRILYRIRNEKWEEVPAALGLCHPADIADIINSTPHDAQARLFSLVNENIKPNVLIDLESSTRSHVLESLSDSEISKIVKEMPPDDTADIIADLSEEHSEKVLELMEKEEQEDVRKLLEYEDDTAGGIMTTDVVAMHENQTVEEALQAIAYFDAHEPFFHANIVDENDKLIGYIDIWELLRERQRSKPLGELVHRDFIAATVNMDQEAVANLMNRYDLTVVPVVDNAGKLVGRITADDVIEVMEEEASEDIFRLAGSDNAELENASTIRTCLVRLPWLFITLGGGFVTSLILKHFHARISEILILAAFVPIVLAMGGNTGIQSSTLIVRSIALGNLEGKNTFIILIREILVGATMGCVCGIIIGIWAHFVIAAPTKYSPILSAGHLAMVVAVALFAAMTFAAMFGALVPITLNKMHIDPAVASGPFVTITNDISALLIYFAVTILLLHRLSGLL